MKRQASRFIRRVRGAILVMWMVAVFVAVPMFVNQATEIYHSAPGASRNEALRDLVAKAVVVLVAVPFIAVGIFGYGVVPKMSSVVTGGSPFVSMWRRSKRVSGTTERTMPDKPLQPTSGGHERADSNNNERRSRLTRGRSHG